MTGNKSLSPPVVSLASKLASDSSNIGRLTLWGRVLSVSVVWVDMSSSVSPSSLVVHGYTRSPAIINGLVWFDFCFKAILGHFGRGQLP